jgi:hypothetical protein
MRSPKSLLALPALCAPLLVLAACGSSTKTVSVRGPAPQTSATSAQASTATTHGTASTPSATTGSGATATTRTAPEPEFTQREHASQGASAASAVVRARGFVPVKLSDYHSNQALTVLIGTRAGSGDGYAQQAFFFVNGRYIGTDASAPSAAVGVVGQSDTEVTLAYPRYRSGDPLCCPSGGQARVRFQLNNGRLTPLDPIPPVTSQHGFSRQ